jgi:hypothetical protein
VEPTLVGCLQIQPIGTISLRADVPPEVGRKQIPIFSDAAPTPVDPFRERPFLTVPAQTRLRQGSGFRVVLIEAIAAGARPH